MLCYEADELHMAGIPLSGVAGRIGTPCYVYDAALLDSAADRFRQSFGPRVNIHFAVKANANLAVLKRFTAKGLGADIVSPGEMERALAAGMPSSRIVYSGVGKTSADLRSALQAGVVRINIESRGEILALARVANELGIEPFPALRINPDIDAGGHDKISTGRAHDKFGVPVERAIEMFALARDSGMPLRGIAVHIGSQITDASPFILAYRTVATLAEQLAEAGHDIHRLDLGGGFGVTYNDEPVLDLSACRAAIDTYFGGFAGEIGIEPGRALVANAGVLLARVIYVKENGDRRIVVVDAGMNDLVRPAMYESWHGIMPVKRPAHGEEVVCDVVGPVCESSDTFAIDRAMPPVTEGDLAVFLGAGAYGATMSSTYNARALVPEVMADDGRLTLIRRPFTNADMMALETAGMTVAE